MMPYSFCKLWDHFGTSRVKSDAAEATILSFEDRSERESLKVDVAEAFRVLKSCGSIFDSDCFAQMRHSL